MSKIQISTKFLIRSVAFIEILAFFISVYYCKYSFPFLDQVDWILSYFQDGVSSLFALHNEHRLPIPRFLIVWDMLWFHGHSGLVTLVSLGALAALVYILVSVLRKNLPHAEASWAFLFQAIVILLLVRGYTIPDYITPSIVQFVLCIALSALSLWVAIKDSFLSKASSLLLALAAAGCGASGLAVLPALTWVFWRLKRHWVWVMTLSLLTVFLPFFYFHGLSFSGPYDRDWLQCFRFMIEYFGAPWERLPLTYPLAILQGSFVIIVLLFAVIPYILNKKLLPHEVFLVAFAAVILMTGFMTAFGRGSFVNMQTQGSRYAVMSAVAGALCFILLSKPLYEWVMKRNISDYTVRVSILILSIFLLSEQGMSTILVHQKTEEIALAKEHVCAGDLSPKYLDVIYAPDRDRAAYFVETLKVKNLYCDNR